MITKETPNLENFLLLKEGDYYFQTIFINDISTGSLKDRIYVVNSIQKLEDFLIFTLIEDDKNKE